MFYASVGVKVMRTRGYVRSQVKHALREGDASASVRPGASSDGRMGLQRGDP